MQECYKMYMNDAQIGFCVDDNKITKKIQQTNRVGTMVYNITLPFLFGFSHWYFTRCKFVRNNYIEICNDNPIKLCNMYITVYFASTHTRFYHFINSSKYCEYDNDKRKLNIYISSLLPGEKIYIYFKSIECSNNYSYHEKLNILVNAQVMETDNGIINISRCFTYKY